MNSEPRLSLLRERLSDEADAFLVSVPANVAYVTGFDGVFDGEDAHAAVVTKEASILYTDSRYGQAASAASVGTPWDVRVVRENLFVAACSDLASAGVKRLAVEAAVPYTRHQFLSEKFSGELTIVENWVERIREVKSAEEIARIAVAQELTDRAFEHVLALVEVGRSEWDIALELEFFMRREGSEGVAFPPIVASGPNSALPHARVTRRTVEDGDFVKLDFGAKVDGYCADMTRTVIVGRASERQIQIYETVLEANLAGIAAVRAGVPGKSIDAVARAVIEARGFGDMFTHGLGHGVGLEVHELPSVGPRGASDLALGSVITVEPGVYAPGYGGVRIEDLVVVEEVGARVLTRSPKRMIEL